MSKITVIVPCYNEEQSLHFFYEEMQRIAAKMKENTFEYLFVDDGSKDRTLECIRELKERDEKVRYVSFSRNFGKEAAIYAGLSHASGDYVAIMDADLQDPPSLLPEMYRAVTEEGYDSAATRRVTRKGEPPIRSFFARRFYHIMNKISDVELMDGARDYRLMNRGINLPLTPVPLQCSFFCLERSFHSLSQLISTCSLDLISPCLWDACLTLSAPCLLCVL